MHVCFACMLVHVPLAFMVPADPEEVSNSLTLGVRTVVSAVCVLGAEPRCWVRAARALTAEWCLQPGCLSLMSA